MTDAARIAAIRDIMTEWNFGPCPDRWALDAIFDIVGDNIQGCRTVSALIEQHQPTSTENKTAV